MRRELREEIKANAERLLQDGTCKTLSKAVAKADALLAAAPRPEPESFVNAGALAKVADAGFTAA